MLRADQRLRRGRCAQAQHARLRRNEPRHKPEGGQRKKFSAFHALPYSRLTSPKRRRFNSLSNGAPASGRLGPMAEEILK
jgi:hypothetical protein